MRTACTIYIQLTGDRIPIRLLRSTCYLFLKEEELRKLTTAMECIRYGLNSGETLGYVGGRFNDCKNEIHQYIRPKK